MVSTYELHGYYATSNVANAFFICLPQSMALHIVGGIYFWGKTTSKFIKKVTDKRRNK